MCPQTGKAPLLSLKELSGYSAQWLVVGLGNPGATYAPTRHNLGYMVTDHLLEAADTPLTPLEGIPALAAPMRVPESEAVRGGAGNAASAGTGGDATALVLRSTTYMNDSGVGVAPVAHALNIPADHIVVIHDELDLPEGVVKLRHGGNENGHNGLKSISEQLSTRDYLRVRMGIARPPRGASIPDWVLSPATPGDTLNQQIETAVQATVLILREGLSKAQNVIHSRSVTS